MSWISSSDRGDQNTRRNERDRKKCERNTYVNRSRFIGGYVFRKNYSLHFPQTWAWNDGKCIRTSGKRAITVEEENASARSFYRPYQEWTTAKVDQRPLVIGKQRIDWKKSIKKEIFQRCRDDDIQYVRSPRVFSWPCVFLLCPVYFPISNSDFFNFLPRVYHLNVGTSSTLKLTVIKCKKFNIYRVLFPLVEAMQNISA